MSDRDMIPFGDEPDQDLYRRSPPAPETGSADLQMGDLLNLFWQSRRLLFVTALLGILAGAAYLLIAPPVYRADALIEIDTDGTAVQALESSVQRRRDSATVSSELLILQSRTVLGEVVDKLELDIASRPEYFPLIGKSLSRWSDGEWRPNVLSTLMPWAEPEKYPWGEQRIDVAELDVPKSLEGHPLTLRVTGEARFEVTDTEGHRIAAGETGERLTLPFGEASGVLKVGVLDAPQGARFSLVKRRRLAAINELQQTLAVSREGNGSALVRVSLEGGDRSRLQQIVSAVAQSYRNKSAERSTAEVRTTLAFIEEQLPIVKSRMQEAQSRLEESQRQQGSVDLPTETRTMLERTVELESELSALERERALFLQKYTANHPEVANLDFRIAELERQLKQANQRVQSLPHTQQQILRLSREAEVAGGLYGQLMNRAQELKVQLSGPLGHVRIVDEAAASVDPVKPEPALILAISLALGLAAGGAIVLLRNLYNKRVEDPDALETQFGLPVYVALPASRNQKPLERKKRVDARYPAVLALSAPFDVTVEALRSLRTSLHVAQANVKNKALLVTSPTMGAGKTFVSSNLATVLATAGKSVLLVDADMRTGTLHRTFGVVPAYGLSNVLAGTAPGPRQAIYGTAVEGLSLLPAGPVPPNPAELLYTQRFQRFVAYLIANYDQVIIDSPPVLPVTDAALISHVVGTTLMVVRDGVTTMAEIDESIKRLNQAGANLRGVVFNARRKSPAAYGYGYGAYGSAYPATSGTRTVDADVWP